MKTATASAAANIALVKYWGKSNTASNQPATGSLSIGLEDLRTTTSLTCTDTAARQDSFVASVALDETGRKRSLAFLDGLRQRFGFKEHFVIDTSNNFPTGAGLASSASGFAALTLAVDALLGLGLDDRTLSRLARTGSGSAARSIFGGYVELVKTEDAYAAPIMAADDWPLDIVVAITTESSKPLGSTQAMQQTAATSPYYREWVASHAVDIDAAKRAISTRDFEQLATVSEHNCLKMHAAIMTSQPAVLYWLPATVAVMQAVHDLRAQGIPAFYSIDAGAQVKVICEPSATDRVNEVLAATPGVLRLIRTTIGGVPEVSVS